MDYLELANRVAEQKLRDQIALMRRLHTSEGFYLYWFEKLGKEFKSNKDCFDHVNALYEDLFGAPRYSDYASFKQYQNRRNKNNG